MRRPTKFAGGGSADKSKARYDRKVADIESDFAKWKKSGKYGNENVAKAKYEQRMADAKDDLAKWTKGDRTQTRAAEKASESALSEARKTKGESIRVRDFATRGDDEPIKTKIDTSLAGRVQTRASAPKKAAPRPATRASTPAPQAKKSYAKEAEAATKVASNVLGSVKAGFEAKTTPEPTREQRKAANLQRLKVAAEAPGSGAYAKDRYRYAKETGMYAKGGSVDGCAVRGMTKIKRK